MDWRDFYDARYQEKRDGKIHRSVNLSYCEHSRIGNQVKKLYPVSQGTRILDVGGGPSTYLSGCTVVATDISHQALQKSRRNIRIQCNAESLPFADNTFDIVICSQVLEHIPNWNACLADMTRVLSVGGLLFIAVPNRYALMKRRYHGLERKIDLSGHIHEFREAQLYFELRHFGYDRIATQGACYDIFWAGASIERSPAAGIIVPLIDRIRPSVLAWALRAESRMRRRNLNGFSLEVWGYKT